MLIRGEGERFKSKPPKTYKKPKNCAERKEGHFDRTGYKIP